MFTLEEMYQQCLESTLQVNFHGHTLYGADTEKQLRQFCQMNLINLESAMRFSKHLSEEDIQEMMVFRQNEPNTTVRFEISCQHCGSHRGLACLDETNTVHFVDPQTMQPFQECQFANADLIHSAEITLPTGRLRVCNTFGKAVEDAPEDVRYTNEYSLNTTLGQQNCTNHLAERDIGMSVDTHYGSHVYLSHDLRKVVFACVDVTDRYFEKEEWNLRCHSEINDLIHNYTHHGCVDSDVWRVMFADAEILQQQDIELPEHSNTCDVSVPPGIWKLTCFSEEPVEERIIRTSLQFERPLDLQKSLKKSSR